MKNLLSNQRGFVPAILLLIMAAVGITGVGAVAASNNSNPGDTLFGLDKTVEEMRVTFTPGDEAKAKIRLEIAGERLDELQTLASTNNPVDPAVPEVQQALSNATVAVRNVEVKFKENKIKLQSTDLQALLTELQTLLATHQGLIRKVEIKIEDGQIKAKIKLFEKEVTESAELVSDDLDDLEDDGQLNNSDDENEEEEEEKDDEKDEDNDDSFSNSNSGSSSSGLNSGSNSGSGSSSSDSDDDKEKD
ncbi:MAG: hypothetical protein UU73_C0003G0265 [Candidatus Daviesbacteria bacterium GW2011_GWA1_41_61]|uniref:DUF5667 domain-containing protein n=1 Tax=Candidatus Daviesbacteria bacterium GW2011_GWA2_40_9 TaxID=1618424 RepID=A0A0G0WEH3_9BACT|nr:MAG: hypothetical protein UU26_C0004G0017 [Candidatus Daviesbacteria bacterium GW2011_GWC1_40_9]KKR82660.1 MAG: hypothetical protein UU29_C0010G0006 [Candidatus Daviesbacteria bacterium GW2011_GWA2_40_9]KKR93385.1 MAG: hypothetical protein UU44_C0002G0046 [Candidatus Daviesbacteria bacterium GW2011_GWB1_41_15]KKS15066.1 MAG: hypothetical protein UU73_C0003G0265 [Candidatus Daviesbacteria bacterium GW2011_GWA1_41_61]